MLDYINQIINQANNDIREIKNYGLQPITLKSPANIIEKFIQPKGTTNEGEFKTYSQYIEQYGYITEQEYYEYVTQFISDYQDQLSLKGAIDYQTNLILKNIEGAFSDEMLDRLESLSQDELIDLIQKAGNFANEAVRNGGYSDVFYYYIEQYMDDIYG